MSKHNPISILQGLLQVLEKDKVKGPKIRLNTSGHFLNLIISSDACKKNYTKDLEDYPQGHLKKNHIKAFKVVRVVKSTLVSLETF